MAKSVRVTIKGEPFMGEPEGADAYYAALGRAIVLWGRFETHLDMALLAAANLPESADLRPAEMPVGFSRRIKLWKRLFNNVPRLDHLRQAAFNWIEQAHHSNKDRQVIAHGHFAEFASDDPLTGVFHFARHQGKMWVREKYDVTLPQLESMAVQFDQLNNALLPVTLALANLNPPIAKSKSPKPEG